MEEKKEKKTTTKKKVDQNKIDEAKKKVNALLQGTGLEDKAQQQQETFVPPSSDVDDNAYQPTNMMSDNEKEWLSQQLTALQQQVEDYERQMSRLRADNANLVNAMNNGGNSMTSSEKNKVIELYKYFESIYTGVNPQVRGAYDTAKFSNPVSGTGILDMFLSTFPYLNDLKNYKPR